MTDEERIAQFLATKGATKVPDAPAFGVDPEADKARRAEAKRQRHLRELQSITDDEAEWRAEEYRERVNDAYMSGGVAARDEEMAWGQARSTRQHYIDNGLVEPSTRRDGRRVRLNRY